LPITFELYDVFLGSVFRLMPYVPFDQIRVDEITVPAPFGRVGVEIRR